MGEQPNYLPTTPPSPTPCLVQVCNYKVLADLLRRQDKREGRGGDVGTGVAVHVRRMWFDEE